MESIFAYVCEHAHHAHWILFCLLLLTGFNIPISEDLILICGGAIASTCVPEHTLRLYIWLFLGCYLSAWQAYWIGRLLGPRLYDIKLFRSIITPKRMEKLRHYYAKFGIFTFIVGRFAPGGIRNALFMSSGLMKMPFEFFIARDGLACLISSMVFFQIGYRFGENMDTVLYYFHHYSHMLLLALSIIALLGLGYFFYHRYVHKKLNQEAE